MLGYFGPAGTFTHMALLSLSDEEARPYPTVAAALDAVRAGEVDGSVVPIENSVEGGVSATLDYLGNPDMDRLQIMNEAIIAVRFVLAVRPGTQLKDIRRIATHSHAVAQTRDWLADNVGWASIADKFSTAGAAMEVANPESEYDAAVCAAAAGELYGLDALATDIADNPDAVTRFVLVRRAGPPTPRTGRDKTTMVAYMREDHSGALLEILQQLAGRGVNLCRIESRPTKTILGSYCFSIDAEGHLDDPRLAEALMGMHRICKDVVYLGSYPRADLVAPNVPIGAHAADYVAAHDWLNAIGGHRLPTSDWV